MLIFVFGFIKYDFIFYFKLKLINIYNRYRTYSYLIMSLIKQVKRKGVNTSVLPSGNSYIDLLPDNVLTYIYGFKHQLEFIDSINMVSRLKVALDSEMVDTRIPIRKLF